MFQLYILALLPLTPISGALAQTDIFGYDAKASIDYQILDGILTAVEERIKTFVPLGGLARTTRHIRTSPWWQRFRSSVPAEKLEEQKQLQEE